MLPQNDASVLILEFLTKNETTVVPQPPHSPDLAPADFFLFPKWKSSLKGRRFQTVEEIEENSIRDLRAVPQNTFQHAFHKLKKRWERGIESGEGYREWRGVSRVEGGIESGGGYRERRGVSRVERGIESGEGYFEGDKFD